jgi:hypothetical protein
MYDQLQSIALRAQQYLEDYPQSLASAVSIPQTAPYAKRKPRKHAVTIGEHLAAKAAST